MSKPYDWVRVALITKADKTAQDKLNFGNRVEFINGVTWVLDYLDTNDLLGILSEVVEGSLPKGNNTALTGDKELKDKGFK